jgi:hypothetical protein
VLGRRTWILILFVSAAGWTGPAQDSSTAAQDKSEPTFQQQDSNHRDSNHRDSNHRDSNHQDSNFVRNVFDLFNMAGTEQAKNFRALTQAERNGLYIRSMVNPLSFVRVSASAGIDQAKYKPDEWEQGASGYGKRFANIFAQYSIQRTATYGLGSLLHEDNRYFNSGKQGFWERTGYAFASGILARRDDGKRRFSISQVGGVAAGAVLARIWLPPSQTSAGDAAVSFGITMGTNIGFGFVKEFLPDMVSLLKKKRKNNQAGY